ncbi:hypothetical protein GJ629_11815 [Halapricum sp. CBA1109]|uniref:hypothetical protein n=1 Tax=Halapricum sp. CBA1109 TaxID=2668068 RepID=UPI0012F8E7F0|nr:hypothetical protein [Halapricum sp. CBA1109]MUV90502.1 hypothetical protein [Halapricum sp. CBA1109]
MAERTDERTREREDVDLDGLGDTEPDLGEIGDVGGDTADTESGIGESIRGLGGSPTGRRRPNPNRRPAVGSRASASASESGASFRPGCSG